MLCKRSYLSFPLSLWYQYDGSEVIILISAINLLYLGTEHLKYNITRIGFTSIARPAILF
jgi:hypothetical protein